MLRLSPVYAHRATKASIMLPGLRYLHSKSRLMQQADAAYKNIFLYTTNASDLAQKIDASILSCASKVPQKQALDALRACRVVEASITSHDKFGNDEGHEIVQKQVEAVLGSENVTFDADLLKEVFLLKFPQSTILRIISEYYKRNPKSAICRETALIAFRDALYNADLPSAIKITDATTGHPNYIAQKNDTLRRGTLRLAASAIGITLFSKMGIQQIIEMGYLSAQWKHLASLNAMVLTYVLNSSFFVAIVRFGRQLRAAGGDSLTWQKGTFYTHWYRHADEMAMCTKIMEADKQLTGASENSPWLVEELCRKSDRLAEGHNLQAGYTRDGHKIRLLEPKDSIEELKMQAYWMSGGDGFEWVEPDQDPADLLWKQHLKILHSPELKSGETRGLKWAEELIEE